MDTETGSRVLALRQSRANRALGLFLAGVGVFTFLWFLGMGGFAVASGLLRDPRPGESGPLADVLLGLGLWVGSIMPFIMMRSYLRTHREKDPHVAVGPEGLTIFHSAVFVDPQLIPGDMIQKIVVGPGVTREFSRIRPLGGEAPVVLSAHAETPNALMVFHRADRAGPCLRSLHRLPHLDRPAPVVQAGSKTGVAGVRRRRRRVPASAAMGSD